MVSLKETNNINIAPQFLGSKPKLYKRSLFNDLLFQKSMQGRMAFSTLKAYLMVSIAVYLQQGTLCIS